MKPSGVTPWQLSKPKVGFNPTAPQYDAGMRMEPPVSVPVAIGISPAPTAAADPPLDPPGIRDVSQGFDTAPKCGFSLLMPWQISCKFVLPTITAPARSNAVTISASSSGT